MARRRGPYPGAVPMFAEPAGARVQPVRRLAATGCAVSWTRMRRADKRVLCDDCVVYLHDHRGAGPAPLAAQYRRRCGTQDLRLCMPHADLHRVEDGLPKFGG